MQKILFCLSQILILVLSIRTIPVKDPQNITIGFGSCYSTRFQSDASDIFYRIVETQPDVWVWIGDASYVDKRVLPMHFIYAGDEAVKASYNKLKNFDKYQFLLSKLPVIGVWDDHDYGINNGDKFFEKKEYVREQFLDFIDEPKNSPRRTNPGGIYDSYYIGDSSKVKVILLDVRYQRDSRYSGTDILGEIQWKWFEEELRTNTAEYIVIGSGTQFFPEDRLMAEVWFPESLQRMIDLIKKYKVGRIILMSGDVHFAEIMKYPCNDRVGFNLYEVTSSGMTHVASQHFPFVEGFINKVYSNTYNTAKDRYIYKNFGLLEFSFGKDGGVNLDIRDESGEKSRLQKYLPRSELEFNETRLKQKGEGYCILDRPLSDRVWAHAKRLILTGERYFFILIGLVFVVTLTLLFSLFGILKLLRWIFRKITRSNPTKQKKD